MKPLKDFGIAEKFVNNNSKPSNSVQFNLDQERTRDYYNYSRQAPSYINNTPN